MALHPCGTVTKISLVIISVIYVFVGFILIGVGITFLVEKDEFQVLTGEDNLVVGIGFIIGGCFTVLIAFLGIISSIGEVYSLLIVYGILTTLLVGTEIAGASICYVEKTNIVNNADIKFKEYIEKYRDDTSSDYNAKVNDVIDVAQSGLHCCGLNNYLDWMLYNHNYTVLYGYPSSCTCSKDTDGNNCIALQNNKGVWKKGCNETFYGLIKSNFVSIGGAGIGIAAVQILMVIFAFGLCLCVMSSKSTERRIARIEAAAYTQMESYHDNSDEGNGGGDGDDNQYETRTVNKEIEPNDDVPISDGGRMYIK